MYFFKITILYFDIDISNVDILIFMFQVSGNKISWAIFGCIELQLLPIFLRHINVSLNVLRHDLNTYHSNYISIKNRYLSISLVNK